MPKYLVSSSRYYESKFGVLPNDVEFRHQVAKEYTIGLCWVLRYYYQVRRGETIVEVLKRRNHLCSQSN